MSTSKRSLVLSGAGLAVVLAVTACGSGTDGSTSMGGMNGHGSSSAASPAGSANRAGDVMFAQMMVPHHQQAIEMADLAVAKASASADVRRLAEQIKAAQDPEIATMNGWLRKWGAPTTAAMDHGTSGMMSEQDMASLEAAEGAEFDRTWLEMMVDHHEGAVTMAQDVLSSTQDAEVQSLARAIVDAQKKEIAMMRGMLK